MELEVVMIGCLECLLTSTFSLSFSVYSYHYLPPPKKKKKTMTGNKQGNSVLFQFFQKIKKQLIHVIYWVIPVIKFPFFPWLFLVFFATSLNVN